MRIDEATIEELALLANGDARKLNLLDVFKIAKKGKEESVIDRNVLQKHTRKYRCYDKR